MPFFVSDVNLASASITHLADGLQIKLVLEDKGKEIKGVGTLVTGERHTTPHTAHCTLHRTVHLCPQ